MRIFLCWALVAVTAPVLAQENKSAVKELKTVEVKEQSAARQAKEQAFAVEVLDVKALRDRNTDLNRLLATLPGVQVRETGGMGSEFEYSIHGLSGKAVRFFIDGVPMETFGKGFSIANLPVNAIEQIEVYKGATPAHLGSDALGGAINLITRKDIRNFIDASYSYGSFHTHKAALSGKLRQARNGFTAIANLAYNTSENNYKVWGPTVEVADEFGRPLPESRKFRRFNDDIRVLTGQVETGFTNTPWADQLLLGVNFSDLRKGIQTGRTMAYVYHDVRNNENFVMPTLRFAKKDFFTKGLNVHAFAAFNRLESTTIDTGSRKFNWAQQVIADNVSGEMGGIRRSDRSRLAITDHAVLAIVNAAYKLHPAHTISFNFNLNNIRRTGKDDLALAEWTLVYREPQHLNQQQTSLSYETQLFDGKWTNLFFVKNFRYSARANAYDYNGGAQKELIVHRNSDNLWGFGYASKVALRQNTLLKFSLENAARLPDATELLGNGNTILNSPGLKPERSLNLNASALQTMERGAYRLNMEAGLFYRNVRDQIWMGLSDLRGAASYENLYHTRSNGAELSFALHYKKWLKLSANGTWQNVRNRQQYTATGAPNLTYNDKMKNMPALLGNAELRLHYPDMLRKGEHLSFYISTHYVERYFLDWPSLGDPATKRAIPEQFVQDAGLTYSFRNNVCSITIECRNILDKQVYDNYLLQKPGRFSSIKLRYFLHNKTQ